MSGPGSDVAFLSRALKAPRIREVATVLATRAREESWDYEVYLAAVRSEEVSSHSDHGGSNPRARRSVPPGEDPRRLRLLVPTIRQAHPDRPPGATGLPRRGLERRVPGSAGHRQDPSLDRAR